MNARTLIAIVALLAVAGLGTAAIATSPDDTPEVGALPSADEPADGPAPTETTADTGQAAQMRPDGPTGKPGEANPDFDGELTVEQIPVLRESPDLEDLDGWQQADGIESLDDLAGQVRVVQFWTFSCSNCKATIPNLQALRDAHADDEDFGIVGVHYPEFDFEEDPDAVADAAQDLGVTWPIALDTRGTNFHGWQEGTGGYWPRTYVLDRDGNIRFDHVGEGRYDELNATVAALLEE